MARGSRVGIKRASMRKNVACEIAVEPSMATALRRPSIACSAVSRPGWTGVSMRASSPGNLDQSSVIDASVPRVALVTSAITGHSTACPGLSRLARPCHTTPPSILTGFKSCETLDVSAGATKASSSGSSRSASPKSSSRLSPRRVARVPSPTPSRSTNLQPRAAAAMRRVASACPTSCWQYRNARSPYFQASRQGTDDRPTRKAASGKGARSSVDRSVPRTARRSRACALGA